MIVTSGEITIKLSSGELEALVEMMRYTLTHANKKDWSNEDIENYNRLCTECFRSELKVSLG